MIRVALLGAGFLARVHAGCYLRHSDVQVVGVAAGRLERAQALAAQLGAKATDRWEALVENAEVDAVDICSPNHLHGPMALAAVAAGKPFLVTKPLAHDLATAQAVAAAQRAAGVTAVYGENFRFAPAYVQAHDLIAQGAIGAVKLVRLHEIHNGPSHADWFWDAAQAGGGALLDLGIHGAYVAQWMTGARVHRVYAETATVKWQDRTRSGAEDSAVCTLRFENGGLGELVTSWAAPAGIDVKAEIYGLSGAIYLDFYGTAGGVTVYSEGGYGPDPEVAARLEPHVSSSRGWSRPIPDQWHLHGHQQLVDHFLACVRGDETPRCTMEEAVAALAVIEAGYRSARSGQPAVVGHAS